MIKLDFCDLKEGITVIDTTGNVGTLRKAENLHNIVVEFQSGGYGFYCLDSKDKRFYDPLYKYENEPISNIL